MAPSDGKTKPDSGSPIVLTAIVISCLSQWVSAGLSCMVGSLDNRILMKEYNCGDYLNKAEIEKSHKMSAEVPAHYNPAVTGNKSNNDGQVTFISPLNISVSLLPKLQAASCYIFKYEIVMNSADGGHELKEVSINANFSCDYPHLCRGQKHGTSKKLRYNGFVGELYCCKGDNCNKEDILQDLPPKQQLCYNGSNDGTRKIAAVDFCTQPETRCARARRTDTVRVEEMYFCDNLHHCQNHSLTLDGSSQEMCKMVRIGEKNIELCCCTRNKCYVPDWLNKPNPQSANPQTPGLSWLFIGGLILMALVCAAILSMGWMGVRHCRRKARDNILTLTYTRLTVSAPEPDTEDSQMLL